MLTYLWNFFRPFQESDASVLGYTEARLKTLTDAELAVLREASYYMVDLINREWITRMEGPCSPPASL